MQSPLEREDRTAVCIRRENAINESTGCNMEGAYRELQEIFELDAFLPQRNSEQDYDTYLVREREIFRNTIAQLVQFNISSV